MFRFARMKKNGLRGCCGEDAEGDAIMKCLGLMSGTSLDGVDCAIADVRPGRFTLRIALLAHRTRPYPPALRQQLLSLIQSGTTEAVCRMHVAVGEVFARVANQTIRQAKLSADDIAVIGSHGQTVWHSPHGVLMRGVGTIRSSLQLGDPAVIAERTGIMTVADFRARDVAVGGEGAPLVPYVHHQLFRSRRQSRLIVNLGGIANVTYVPCGGAPQDVRAFDTGPCNLLLDGLIATATKGKWPIDRNGTLALQGCHREAFANKLLAHSFYGRRPPKSTGREEFDAGYIRRVWQVAKQHRLSVADMLASSCAGIAQTIHRSMQWIPGPVAEVIVGGGGVRNRALMAALKRQFGPSRVLSMDQVGVNSKAVEAMAFAVLACQTIRGVPTNLPSVTGARSPVVLGTMTSGRNPVSLRLSGRSRSAGSWGAP